MKRLVLRTMVVAIVMACGSAQAVNYVKLSGDNVDFYYDADFWTLGATVSGDSISVNTGALYQRADVTTGAATPSQGTLDTALVDYTHSFSQNLIAVAHSGYQLNNDIGFSASTTLQSNGYSGSASYYVENTYTGGSYSGGVFSAADQIGIAGQTRFFQYDGSAHGGDTQSFPLDVTTTVAQHAAIAVDGYFDGRAEIFGLGTAAVGLNGITYSFAVSAVPEPGQFAMLGAGLLLLGWSARRRQR